MGKTKKGSTSGIQDISLGQAAFRVRSGSTEPPKKVQGPPPHAKFVIFKDLCFRTPENFHVPHYLYTTTVIL